MWVLVAVSAISEPPIVRVLLLGPPRAARLIGHGLVANIDDGRAKRPRLGELQVDPLVKGGEVRRARGWRRSRSGLGRWSAAAPPMRRPHTGRQGPLGSAVLHRDAPAGGRAEG